MSLATGELKKKSSSEFFAAGLLRAFARPGDTVRLQQVEGASCLPRVGITSLQD